MRSRLRVEYWPPWPDTPYLASIARALPDHGVDAVPIRLRDRLRSTDVLHLNWPDLVWAARNPLQRMRSTLTVLAARWLARRRRIPFVVTCHNLEHHEGSSRLGDRLQSWLIRSADRVIVLSASGVDRLVAGRPHVARSDVVAIPHPLFTDRYRRLPRDEAIRIAPFMPPLSDDQVWLTFGKIRPYKGIAELLESLARHPDLAVRLVVLGARYPRGSQSDLVTAIANDDRVIHVDRLVDDDEIAAACSLADAVVLPYLQIENSGAAFTALTLSSPVVAPAIGSFPELAEKIGARVQLYEPPADVARIAELVEHAVVAPLAEIGAFEPDEVARRHADLYRSVVAGLSHDTP